MQDGDHPGTVDIMNTIEATNEPHKLIISSVDTCVEEVFIKDASITNQSLKIILTNKLWWT